MTALSFLTLDQGITQVRLAEGSINIRVSELREGTSMKLTPRTCFHREAGWSIRVDVAEMANPLADRGFAAKAKFRRRSNL